jgi:ferredoxin, 2Fe-2S
MPHIIFVQHNGTKVDVDAEPGNSVMQIAIANDIDGIVGECGGNAVCATCHVYVTEGPLERLSVISETEDEMLECAAAERNGSSRLSCQIRVSDAIEGLVVTIPETQVWH